MRRGFVLERALVILIFLTLYHIIFVQQHLRDATVDDDQLNSYMNQMSSGEGSEVKSYYLLLC